MNSFKCLLFYSCFPSVVHNWSFYCSLVSILEEWELFLKFQSLQMLPLVCFSVEILLIFNLCRSQTSIFCHEDKSSSWKSSTSKVPGKSQMSWRKSCSWEGKKNKSKFQVPLQLMCHWRCCPWYNRNKTFLFFLKGH